MRLRGVRFTALAGPVHEGFAPLGDFTAVIGANDAGKSRLMRHLCDGLSANDGPVRVYYEHAYRAETKQNLREALAESHPGDPKDPSWHVVRAELERSEYFAFSLDGSEGVFLCLPPRQSLPESVRIAVDRLVRGADLHAASARTRLDVMAEVCRDGDSKYHEPIPCLNVNGLIVEERMHALMLPMPVRIPDDPAPLRAGLLDAMTALLRVFRCYDDAAANFASVTAVDPPTRESLDWLDHFVARLFDDEQRSEERLDLWMEPGFDGGMQLSGDAVLVLQILERMATAFAPRFMTCDYNLRGNISESGGRVSLSLQLAVQHQDELLPSPKCFAIEEAADGHRVWIELALTQTMSTMIRLAEGMHGYAEYAAGTTEGLSIYADDRAEARQLAEGGAADSEDMDARHDHLDRQVEQAAEEAITAIGEFFGIVAALRAGEDPLHSSFSEADGGTAVLRPPFFVVDEPERHLHPRLQHQMALGIKEFTGEHGGQGLVITHSWPFINQADAIAYVDRLSFNEACVRSLSADDLRGLSEVAGTLGLDRGHLLTDVSVFLYVEGESDRHVLEALFRERLRRAGVVILVLAGATQLPQMADFQVPTRFTTARLAVMLDSLERWEYKRLVDDSSHRAAVLKKGRPAEAVAVAKLIEATRDVNRLPTFIELPVEDMFFLLDGATIRETFRELRGTHDVYTHRGDLPRFDEYPGHSAAQDRYAEASGVHWKVFLRDTYGIPLDDVSWYARVADRMLAQGLLPPELVRVIERLEELASDDRRTRFEAV